jgi:ankyrin repeat protein
VADKLDTEKDINCFVRTSRYLHSLLNAYLYERNVRCSCSSGLLWAAKNGRVSTALLLFEAGANPQTIATLKGLHRIPLHEAAQNGHADLARLLLEKMDLAGLNREDCRGATPLLLASMNRHAQAVELLLAVDGILPNFEDHDGQTPLLQAAKRGDAALVQLLLAAKGIEPNYESPILVAAERGHARVVELMLAAEGIVPNVRNHQGNSSLLLAIRNGHIEVLKVLLATDAVDRLTHNLGLRSSLFEAVYHDQWEAAKLLIKAEYPTALTSRTSSSWVQLSRAVAAAHRMHDIIPNLNHYVPSPFCVGDIAPMDVELRAGDTGLSPTWRRYFQIYSAPTKIRRGKVRVLKNTKLVRAGEELHRQKAVFLNMLNIAHLE